MPIIISLRIAKISDLMERSANSTCQNFGPDWSVDRIKSNALVCTKRGVIWSDNCNDCTTWRMIVWQDGGFADDTYNGQSISTVAGKYYGGHSPCKDLDNFQDCGVWGSSSGKRNCTVFLARLSIYLKLNNTVLMLLNFNLINDR